LVDVIATVAISFARWITSVANIGTEIPCASFSDTSGEVSTTRLFLPRDVFDEVADAAEADNSPSSDD
jgi:hypothetical protein